MYNHPENIAQEVHRRRHARQLSLEAYFSSKTQTIINKNDIDTAINTSNQQILNIIDVWMSEGSGWTIEKESVLEHFVNITKYAPLRGGSYIELPRELRNASKGLINIKNEDDEYFRWCHESRR